MVMLARPTVLLRLEGLALPAAVGGYVLMSAPWGPFAVLLLAPDLSMAGDLAGPRTGAAGSTAAHTSPAPLLLAALASASGWALGLPIALVWAAHVGLDRALGHGLKHPDGFHQTHLGPTGPARHA